MNVKKIFLAAAISVLSVGSVSATQIVLDKINVIGFTQDYASVFKAENILDNQLGDITENNQTPNDAEGGFWLNPDNGSSSAWITIDLGATYALDYLELFNTHNGPYYDRGTGDFRILASNSIQAATNGFDLVGGITLVDATLSAQGSTSSGILDAQAFNTINGDAYRYIQFNADSVAAAGNQCCGTNVYGLNEIRVYGGASTNSVNDVPEPSILALLGFGLLGLGLSRRKSA